MSKLEQLLKRARAYAAKRRVRPAMEAYAEVCKSKPRDPDIWIECGESGESLGDPSFAAMAFFGAADLRAQRGEGEEAISLCQQVLQLDPTHEGARRLTRMLEGRRKRVSTQPRRARDKGADDDIPAQPESRPAKLSPDRIRRRNLRRAEGARRTHSRPTQPTSNDPIGGENQPDSVGGKFRRSSSQADLSGPEIASVASESTSKRKTNSSAFDGMTLGEPDCVTDFPLDDEDQLRVVEAVAANISSSPLLSELDSDLVRYLVECASVAYAPTGKVVVREGESGTSLYIVLQGSVRVERNDPKTAGHETLTTLKRGSFFGEMALLTDAPRIATVRCAEPTTLLEVTREAVRELIRRDSRVLKLLMRFFRSRMVTNLVASSELFAPFSPSECRQLTTKFQLRELPPGYLVVEQGQPADGLYLVLVGILHAFSTISGRRQQLGSLFPGDVFAETSLLDGRSAEATITTDDRVWLLRLPREDFHNWITEYPRLRKQLDEIVLTRSRDGRGDKPVSMSPI